MVADGGEAFEKECIEGIRAEGRIKMVQRYSEAYLMKCPRTNRY